MQQTRTKKRICLPSSASCTQGSSDEIPHLPTLTRGLEKGRSWLQPFHHSGTLHCLHLSSFVLALPTTRCSITRLSTSAAVTQLEIHKFHSTVYLISRLISVVHIYNSSALAISHRQYFIWVTSVG